MANNLKQFLSNTFPHLERLAAAAVGTCKLFVNPCTECPAKQPLRLTLSMFNKDFVLNNVEVQK